MKRRCQPAYFDPEWYLETYEDVREAGTDPLQHYLRHGRTEGRLPCPMTAVWRERDLRWGMLEDGIAALETLSRDGDGADRAWALLACARADARAGNWASADARLRQLGTGQALIGGFCLPDHALLAIESAVMVNDPDRAETLWRMARTAFGPLPDLALAGANIAAMKGGFERRWRQHLARLFARWGLPGIALSSEGPETAFDRLQPALPVLPRPGGPVVSVLMPARNAETTIAAALTSLQTQSWRNLEILVIDNGSQDHTAGIVRRMATGDPRIRLLDGADEPGAYPARNIGLEAARGAFITVLDADDWAHPSRIARQVRALRRNRRYAASLSHWVRTTPDLRFTRWWGEAGLTHRNISSLMIRAELRDRLGYWDRARAGADTEYHNRILSVFGPEAIAEVCPGLPLSFGRVTEGSLTRAGATGIGTQHYGARRSYDLASRRWHARMQVAGDLPLPRHPARRPFAIPETLDPGDPPPGRAGSGSPDPLGDTLFDDRWYMQTYPDLRARNVEGETHYREQGAAEGRNPGPDFSTTGYRIAQSLDPSSGDVPDNATALSHYLREGRDSGLSPLPVFAGDLPAPAPGRHLLFFGHQANARIYGAERSLLDMMSRAIRAGFTPSVVMPGMDNAGYLAALRARTHKVHVLPYGWLYGGVAPHPATLARLGTLIRDSGAVEVHQNTLVLDAPLRAARAANVPCVVHARELPAEDPGLCMDLGVTHRELRQHMHSWADRFVANSEAVARWLAAPERTTILPNSVDPALGQLPFAPGARLRVALIGSLSAKKGIADFLTVARAFAATPELAEFLLIGPESPELAALSPLPGNTRHAGYHGTPAEALAGADIVLSLSHVAESFGRTVLEALSAGRPVICYDRGTPPSLIGSGGAGQVVPDRDPQAVITTLRAWLSRWQEDPAGLRAMSAAARLRAAELRRQAENVPDDALFRAGTL